ncbi:non-canonical purine NTP pyrophosphatase [Candidatus Vallotia tarda]|uniref:dITP/XTP pyrophosphatase n=1 Tax=Candidatus Vallotiella hemipterorum TaxID=1177213 RepID=A0A916JTE4_9BURK|nr:non-canonical purine NTP pyrophosphatase [Candidatus Vallotia tarda]CAG7600767.1 Non-canonical purine NTP pyrophosphatase [Candidatus Vallotia tarda]
MNNDPRSVLPRIVLASNNPSKLREFFALNTFGIELIPQHALCVDKAPEPHSTFIENALEKARHAAHITGLPALADDSGLCVHALGGAPGVYSASYAKLADDKQSDAANNARLLEELREHSDRRAYYYCVLVLLRHVDDPEPLIASGRWNGEILTKAYTGNGFGYDPLFYVSDLQSSVAQLDLKVKNTYSHRALAVADLTQRLENAW